nr:MAG TPA: hypothetical protein [Caudoviricetes sp.]
MTSFFFPVKTIAFRDIFPFCPYYFLPLFPSCRFILPLSPVHCQGTLLPRCALLNYKMV